MTKKDYIKFAKMMKDVSKEMELDGIENPEELMAQIAEEQAAQQEAMGDIYNENE